MTDLAGAVEAFDAVDLIRTKRDRGELSTAEALDLAHAMDLSAGINASLHAGLSSERVAAAEPSCSAPA